MQTPGLRTTPFHPRTAALMEGAAWRRWAGYTVASCYELSHEREYWAIRNSAALIDVTPLYKYLVHGPGAARLLDRVVTRDITKLQVGQVYYTPWCDTRGKVIDDGTISRLDDTTFRMTSADPNERWLTMNARGLDVSIQEISEAVGALSLQGPTSRAILASGFEGGDVEKLKYFRFVAGRFRGIPVTISRTGYTGDLGYEIWVESGRALDLWDALVEAGTPHGLTPTGILGLDIARIEAGLIMIEIDYVSAHHALIESQTSSPWEINLGWTVSLTKGPHNGLEALRAEKEKGSQWQFVGIDVEWTSLEALFAEHRLPPRLPAIAWRMSVPLYAAGRQVGYASSGCWSPLLKKMIALAHIETPWAKPGTEVFMEVTVEHHRRQAAAKVAALPFFNPERKRA